MRITHLILGLNKGGAENMLLKLVREFSKQENIDQEVIIFSENCYLLSDFNKINNLTVVKLKSKNVFSNLFILPRLINQLWKYQPDVLQCWMYHSEFLGTIAKFFYWKKLKLFWNIRCSGLEWKKRSFLNNLIFMFLSRFSFLPNAIISNTSEGIANHVNLGYMKTKMIKIGNGFEIENYQIIDKVNFFSNYGIDFNSKAIVMVARFNYIKDHQTLIQAFDDLLEDDKFNDTVLILIGKNDNEEVNNYINSSDNSEKIYSLGVLDNVNNLLPIFDVGVLCSLEEGFPNVIGEYVLAKLPVIATDVGETSCMLEDKSFLVTPKDYKQMSLLFKRTLSLSEEQKTKLTNDNYDIVMNNYNIKTIMEKYNNLYEKA